VTGAAGFIGARFVESCNARGVPVVSVDREGAFAARAEHRGLDFGERLDVWALADWLAARRAPIAGIVHLGAISDTTELDVARLDRFNVEYSKQLWSAARERGVPYVYASSAAVYGDGALGFDDADGLVERLRPLNPYGESKRLFDLWALAESAAGREPRAWAGFRFFNVYGFGERHKGPQASVVLHGYDQATATGRIRLFRSHRPDIPDGHQARDFVAVELAVAAMWFALERPIRRGVFNVGTGRARTFLDLARAVFAALGRPEAIDWVDTPLAIRERYQYHTEARMDRLRGEGFSATPATLEEGVRQYVERLERAKDRNGRHDPGRAD